MRLLLPASLPSERVNQVRAVAPDVAISHLRVRELRLPGARALRVAGSRPLPYAAWRAVHTLTRYPPCEVTVDGMPLEHARDADALLVGWELDARAVRAVVAGLPALRWIHSLSRGRERFDEEHLRARGVELTATPAVHSTRLAEFVMAHVYADAKRVPERWRDARSGRVNRAPSTELRDVTLGVVGYGAVGREVARLATANGLRVIAHDIDERRALPPVHGVSFTSDLRQLLAATDVLVIALPLTPATRGRIGPRAFEAVRPGVLLVNVGRGATIDEDALVRAIDDGRVRRAVLDVIGDDDDVPANHPLLRRDAVLYTGHRAAASPRSDNEVFQAFLDELRHRHGGAERVPMEGT